MNCLNKVRVHDLTIRNGHEGSRPKSVQTKNTLAQRKILTQDFWKISLWTDETEGNLCGQCLSWPSWTVRSTASGPGGPAVIDGTNIVVYHKILKQNLNSWLPSQEHFGYAAEQWPETTGPPLNENKIICFWVAWWKSRLKSDGAALVGPLTALKRKSGQSPSTVRKNHQVSSRLDTSHPSCTVSHKSDRLGFFPPLIKSYSLI